MQIADLVFVATLGGFFALTWGFVRLCERLSQGQQASGKGAAR